MPKRGSYGPLHPPRPLPPPGADGVYVVKVHKKHVAYGNVLVYVWLPESDVSESVDGERMYWAMGKVVGLIAARLHTKRVTVCFEFSVEITDEAKNTIPRV